MKKVCIVTICNGSNFGNRLQNYALQETIRRAIAGAEVVTARNICGEIGKSLLKNRILFALIQSGPVTSLVFKFVNRPKIRKKMMFLRFNRRYITWSKRYIDRDYVPENFENEYDYFVAGSDQIWNPYMPFNSSVEFLCFAPPEKRIAYAASFGISEPTDEQQELINERLKGFKNISVREVSGLQILEKAGIHQGKVTLDPTMLLTAGEWEKIEERPRFELQEANYALLYILDENNTEARKYIDDISRENGWKVVDIADQSNTAYYGIGPAEFVYLIHHAAYICTDSFHATVFSILFHKRFRVFTRWNMNGRISTLLNMLDEKYIHPEGNYYESRLEYGKTDEKLELERRRSIEFLKEKLQ